MHSVVAMGDWDDLRFFLAVAAGGSTSAAGQALKTSQSTVFRRIAALEQSLELTLFDKRASGYTLTAEGRALLPAAERIAREVDAFALAAAGERRKTMTIIRFSAPDVVMEYMLPSVMAAFRERYPQVQIELLATDRKVDLASGEADVALRAGGAPSDPELFGRRLAYDLPALTASRGYAERHPLPATNEEVADHSLINLTTAFGGPLGEWFARWVPRHRVLLQPDSIAGTLTAVRGGLGLAVLPRFLSDRDPSLVAAPLTLPVPPYELWIMTHERLRDAPAVRALMDFVSSYVLATMPRATA
jgi:DNA-binding transcriptional LysR family regulator